MASASSLVSFLCEAMAFASVVTSLISLDSFSLAGSMMLLISMAATKMTMSSVKNGKV